MKFPDEHRQRLLHWLQDELPKTRAANFDMTILKDYIIGILSKDRTSDQLHHDCLTMLDEFLGADLKPFCHNLFLLLEKQCGMTARTEHFSTVTGRQVVQKRRIDEHTSHERQRENIQKQEEQQTQTQQQQQQQSMISQSYGSKRARTENEWPLPSPPTLPFDLSSDKTRIIATNIPVDQNNVRTLSAFFRRFGDIKFIEVYDDTKKARIDFMHAEDAWRAFHCPDAVLGNRFIQLKWQGAQSNRNGDTDISDARGRYRGSGNFNYRARGRGGNRAGAVSSTNAEYRKDSAKISAPLDVAITSSLSTQCTELRLSAEALAGAMRAASVSPEKKELFNELKELNTLVMDPDTVIDADTLAEANNRAAEIVKELLGAEADKIQIFASVTKNADSKLLRTSYTQRGRGIFRGRGGNFRGRGSFVGFDAPDANSLTEFNRPAPLLKIASVPSHLLKEPVINVLLDKIGKFKSLSIDLQLREFTVYFESLASAEKCLKSASSLFGSNVVANFVQYEDVLPEQAFSAAHPSNVNIEDSKANNSHYLSNSSELL